MTSRIQKFRIPLVAAAVLLAIGGSVGIGYHLGQTNKSANNTPAPQASLEEIERRRSIPKPRPQPDLAEDLATTDNAATAADATALLVNALEGIHDPDTPPERDIRILDHLLSEARALFHRLPTGTHEDIVAFLQGRNPKSFAYFPPDHPALDADGRLRDRWGTPYFFHVVSSQEIEVRSAGPDLLHWSEDDLVSPLGTHYAETGRQ